MNSPAFETIFPAYDETMRDAAQRLLADMPSAPLLVKDTTVVERFQDINVLCSDADGTLVSEGATSVSAAVKQRLMSLAELGVRTVIVTGKPRSEIMDMARSLIGLPVDFLYEKGAYLLECNANGTMKSAPLLSTHDDTNMVAALRKTFLQAKPDLEGSSGLGGVMLGFGGHGTHESMLSIDALNGDAPANYLDMMGETRDNLKVKDPERLQRISEMLKEYFKKEAPGWNFVDLGNANFEIGPRAIEKDRAVQALRTYRDAEGVLTLGDSPNDEATLRLGQDGATPVVSAGLVLHRAGAIPLVDAVDCVSFGMANAEPHLGMLTHMKSR